YSFIQFKKTDIEEKGLITCGKQNQDINQNINSDTNSSEKCFISFHIHTYIPVTICDTAHSLAKFKGPLNKNHTHGDENVIHFHNKIPFDKKTNKFLETPLKLENIFKDLELSVSLDELIGGKIYSPYSVDDGSGMCGGVKANWQVFVNGKFNQDWRNYEWKDRA
ncbi:MAG: hypothetical protein AAB693_02545, partial [Patescibacteria group bacterium]